MFEFLIKPQEAGAALGMNAGCRLLCCDGIKSVILMCVLPLRGGYCETWKIHFMSPLANNFCPIYPFLPVLWQKSPKSKHNMIKISEYPPLLNAGGCIRISIFIQRAGGIPQQQVDVTLSRCPPIIPISSPPAAVNPDFFPAFSTQQAAKE